MFYRSIDNILTQGVSNYGIRFQPSFTASNDRRITADIEISRNAGELLALLNITYIFRGAKTQSYVNPRIALVNHPYSGMKDYSGTVQTRHNFQNIQNNRTSVLLRGDFDQRNSLLSALATERAWGNSEITARYFYEDSEKELTARFSSSFVTDFHDYQIGNGNNQSTGVLVTAGNDKAIDADFELLVDGLPRARLKSGRTRFVSLPPYKTYEFQLQNLGGDLVSVSSERYLHTLYPGNVTENSWETKKIIVLIGRLLSDQGQPIANALIQNAEGLAISDEMGYFQAEMDLNTQVLRVRKGDFLCSVNLPAMTAMQEEVYFAGDLSCGGDQH